MLDRKPRQLSGGQRQRVAMGRAIVRQPKVFLFDEPLSNLDAKLRIAMRVEIRKLQRRLSTTSIYVTHDQLEAMTLADILVVMNGGQVEQIGNPLEIYEKPATTFVASFIGAPPMNLMSTARRRDRVAARRRGRAPRPASSASARRISSSRPDARRRRRAAAHRGSDRAGRRRNLRLRHAGQDEQRIAANPGELPPGEIIVRIPGTEAPPSARGSGRRGTRQSCICSAATAAADRGLTVSEGRRQNRENTPCNTFDFGSNSSRS